MDALCVGPGNRFGPCVDRFDACPQISDLRNLGDRDAQSALPRRARECAGFVIHSFGGEESCQRDVHVRGRGAERAGRLAEVLVRGRGGEGDPPGVLDIGEKLLREDEGPGNRPACGRRVGPATFDGAEGARDGG